MKWINIALIKFIRGYFRNQFHSLNLGARSILIVGLWNPGCFVTGFG